MIDWKPIATWPPSRHAGLMFIFWQPAIHSGRITLPARVTDRPDTGPRSATHWAQVNAP